MPNHVHLIAVPQVEAALCRGIGEVHRRYTRHVNFREGWRGHLPACACRTQTGGKGACFIPHG